jgi:hypothetical protein
MSRWTTQFESLLCDITTTCESDVKLPHVNHVKLPHVKLPHVKLTRVKLTRVNHM